MKQLRLDVRHVAAETGEFTAPNVRYVDICRMITGLHFSEYYKVGW